MAGEGSGGTEGAQAREVMLEAPFLRWHGPLPSGGDMCVKASESTRGE
jgi:hypothetical protein